jgi:hypothetical protein
MTTNCNYSIEEEQKYFPADQKQDMQVKFQEHVQDVAGNIIAVNKNDDSCYENAPKMEIAIEDFDFYMQVFSNYEKDKKKRAECQKKYFQNNRKTYYERQKKWRDGHKIDFNKKRRERYAELKKQQSLVICDELPPPQSVPLTAEVVEVVEVSEDVQEHPQSEKDDGAASLSE